MWIHLRRYSDFGPIANKRCQKILLSRQFEFPAHKRKKKLIQNFCSGEWFSTFYWQWDQCQNTFNKIVNPEHDIRTKALASYSLTQPQRRKRILQDEYKTFRNRNQTNTAARTVGKRCAP